MVFRLLGVFRIFDVPGKSKNQYLAKTESFRGKIGNREQLTRLIFPPTVFPINE